MELVPWRPFGELSSFRPKMLKLWDRSFCGKPLVNAFSEGWSSSVEISETEDELLVNAELPGLAARDVNVSIPGDLLKIMDKKKWGKEEEVPLPCWMETLWVDSFRVQQTGCRTEYVRSVGQRLTASA